MVRGDVGSDRPEAGLHALARERARVAWTLTAAVVLVYFGFVLSVAFAREALGALVVPGLSVGILAGALVIVVSWLLTWVYVGWANRRYDPALRELQAARGAGDARGASGVRGGGDARGSSGASGASDAGGAGGAGGARGLRG